MHGTLALHVETLEKRGGAPAEVGVYYAENDVAGLVARLVALGVDVILVALRWGVLSLAASLFELPQSVRERRRRSCSLGPTSRG